MTKQTKVEAITITDAIKQAVEGNGQPLDEMIAALTKERDTMIEAANRRVAGFNAQIELLSTILVQARGSNGNGLD